MIRHEAHAQGTKCSRQSLRWDRLRKIMASLQCEIKKEWNALRYFSSKDEHGEEKPPVFPKRLQNEPCSDHEEALWELQ